MQTSEPRRLRDFAGRWQVKRRIDPVDGLAATFDGHAVWSDRENGLAYTETGVMTLNGQIPMQAERRYLWTKNLSVYFDDGRFFHSVPSLGGDTAHWCDPDRYIGHYDFSGWPQFRVTWQVNGPRKDYRSETFYTRA
ncbi:MAG: DUF6314 family protein [Pseudomonadota bacterium]